ncbi:hypothetical protein V1512DRAFT_261805 [Lipomyces arxii]|uniref:uncharacterized protein n=1 Tax=Lipomyces arxii TaxID=56418 RepID=UPI0034CF7AC2
MPAVRLSGWTIVRILVVVVVILVLFKSPSTPKSASSESFNSPYVVSSKESTVPSNFAGQLAELKDGEPSLPGTAADAPAEGAITQTDGTNYAYTEQPSIQQAASVEYADAENMDASDLADVKKKLSEESGDNWTDNAQVGKSSTVSTMSTSTTTIATTTSSSSSTSSRKPAATPAALATWRPPKPIDISFPPPRPGERGLVTVYLVNTPRYHFEVVLPILHAFSSLPFINVTLFAGKSGYGRFGVGPLLERETMSYGLRMVDIVSLKKQPQPVPDYVFLTSCPEDIKSIGKDITAWLNGGAKVQCLVHEPGRWDATKPDSDYGKQIEYMRPWLNSGKWEMVTLAPHVSSFIKEAFPKYMGTPNVAYDPAVIHPVFQPNPQEVPMEEQHPFAAIPGKYEEGRRNYQKVFKELLQLKPDVNVHLVGTGNDLNIPSAIRNRIIYVRDLDFPGYFDHLAQALTIIPAFATQAYTKNQASSTVATALIVGTPLMADQNIRNAYSQIPLDAMYLQESDETEIEALTRIMKLPASEWKAKKTRVLEVRDQMMEENLAYFENVMKKIYAERHAEK